MPPLEAIMVATSKPAAVLGQQGRLGELSPGALADIIAVPGDPLADIAIMGKVHFVMQGGIVRRHDH
jgi:imidazolonepropionase-like amidohydrolase